ncbi:MAG: VOC family protein [Solirubrobacterales bacterium]
MGTRTEHASGTFSWIDLTTSDGPRAKDFYGELMGWEFEDNEIPGNGGVYTMCRVGGSAAAAIAPTTEDLPTHWNSYVTVSSADDAAVKAKELGSNVIMEPFDVMDAGRMAVLADPTGAAVSVWEARDSIGAERVNEPGCLTWNELHTPDPGKALEFYTALFGWNTEEMDTQGGPSYTIISVGERSNGGVMDAQEGEPPNWLPYLVVEDRDAAADKAKQLGGNELFRMEMPQGQIAILTDPQGAPFGVWAGETDD